MLFLTPLLVPIIANTWQFSKKTKTKCEQIKSIIIRRNQHFKHVDILLFFISRISHNKRYFLIYICFSSLNRENIMSYVKMNFNVFLPDRPLSHVTGVEKPHCQTMILPTITRSIHFFVPLEKKIRLNKGIS